MNMNEAKLELAVIECDIVEDSKLELVTRLTNEGFPQEVVTRISQLWDQTKKIGEEIYHVGKIIISKILAFLKANPNLTAGMGVGLAIGILIPFVGPILMPLAVAVGAVIGVRLDNYEQGSPMAVDAIGVSHEVVMLSRKFFDLIVEIFEAVQLSRA